jgi:hypothetical protein
VIVSWFVIMTAHAGCVQSTDVRQEGKENPELGGRVRDTSKEAAQFVEVIGMQGTTYATLLFCIHLASVGKRNVMLPNGRLFKCPMGQEANNTSWALSASTCFHSIAPTS